jgi:hypothetical protein
VPVLGFRCAAPVGVAGATRHQNRISAQTQPALSGVARIVLPKFAYIDNVLSFWARGRRSRSGNVSHGKRDRLIRPLKDD